MNLTATEVARATGTSPRSIRRAVAELPPASTVNKSGNETPAWHLMDLPSDLREKVDPYDLRALQEMVDTWLDAHRPTDAEQARLLDSAFLKLDALIQQGASERVMKARQIEWLVKHARALAPNEAALRRMFNRYLDRWRKGGRKLSAIRDLRPNAAKARRAPKLPKEDVDRLAVFAVVKQGGRLYPAWLQCWDDLSTETRERYPRGKEVPARIRQQVMPEIRRLMPWHIGPRAARLNGCYLERDWSNVFAGDWYSSDDVTLPVYVFDPANPREPLRGQFLPMIDVKSQRILDFAFEVSKSYTALTIRALISRVCMRHGLPRRGFHFESGIWKNAKIIGGGARCEPWNDVGETFADRLGLRLMHSLPGNARAKIVERVIGILQDMLEGEPGYVGRDEMGVKYEAVQRAKRDVEAGRVHPSKAGFLSVEQWMKRLHEICEAYNARVRDSEVMGGRMSPDEAWENLQARDAAGAVDQVVKLTSDLRYLLAAHKEIVTVTRSGIKLLNSKYCYTSEVTGELKGQTVIAWFDPEQPETLAITDLKGENMRTLPRRHKLPAYDAWENDPDLARASSSLVNAHNGYGRRRYSELKTRFFPPTRKVFAEPSTLEKGRHMERQRTDLLQRRREFSQDEVRAEAARRDAELEKFERENQHLFI